MKLSDEQFLKEVDFAKKESLVDDWWSRIINSRKPTNNFEKNKLKHCYFLDYEDIKKLKNKLFGKEEIEK